MNPGTRLIELNHAIEDGMVTYKGLPAPVICDYLSRAQSQRVYAEGTEFQIGKMTLVGNTGTYIDTPFHRFPDGFDLAGLPLQSITELDGVVVRALDLPVRAISRSAFAGLDVAGKAVLVHTNWAKHWRTDRYFEGHPFLTSDAAEYLRDRGATLVGIDSQNIDCTDDGHRPVHTVLLGAGIPIVEHLRGLEQLPDTGFRFSALPPRIQGMGSFPVRAYASLNRR